MLGIAWLQPLLLSDPGEDNYAIVTGYGAHIEEIERIRERLSGS